MKKIIPLVLIVLLISVGCATRTEYIQPDLPCYDPIRPVRPKLENISVPVPVEVNRNTVKLMSYITQLETYGDGWEEFYEGLRNAEK